MKVLVADADRSTCDVLKRWLAPQHEVLVTTDGERALQAARDARPDVVIVDAGLPRLSGLSVAWVLKNDARYGGTHVVLLRRGNELPVAPDSPDDTQIWAGALGDGHLLKPFSEMELRAALPRTRAKAAAVVPILPAGADRRLAPRRHVRIPARIAAPDAASEGWLLTLSLCGAYVQSDLVPPSGTSLRLVFDAASGRFEGPCQVVNAYDRGVGIRFEELRLDQQALLVSTLDAARA